MPQIAPASEARPARHVPVVVVGGGACGLSAAMAVRDAGGQVIVVERDAIPRGNTAWSIAMIPGAASRIQRLAGVEDDATLFTADILAKTKHRTDADMVRRIAGQSGPAIDWLTERHGLELRLLTELVYPGHSRHRYHVPPTITGVELQQMLLDAAARAGVTIATGHHVTRLYAEADGRVVAVGGEAGEGQSWTIGCDALILATDGFGASAELVSQHIPEMRHAVYCGHDGTLGDGLRFGVALGAATADLGAYQGHSVGLLDGLPQTWALIIDGGIQVDRHGRRFANEMRGYSEQAADIVRQDGSIAWTIFDSAAERNALLLDNHRTMSAAGHIVVADDIDALADALTMPVETLKTTLDEVARSIDTPDRFGRRFAAPLQAPYKAIAVRGSLFHTQGGLVIDRDARVLRPDGTALPNLFAGGGAARGISGPTANGYLGGNGLLCAIVLGKIAGTAAAEQVHERFG